MNFAASLSADAECGEKEWGGGRGSSDQRPNSKSGESEEIMSLTLSLSNLAHNEEAGGGVRRSQQQDSTELRRHSPSMKKTLGGAHFIR